MTTKQLHFKWTVSRGRDTYGYNICTLLVDGEKVGKCNGGGYDMQGTSFAQWLQNNYQHELLQLFSNQLQQLKSNPNAESYLSKKQKTIYTYQTGFYGAHLYHNTATNESRVTLDGACGFESIKQVAEAIGIKLKWNPESNKYKNHAYYTAIIN